MSQVNGFGPAYGPNGGSPLVLEYAATSGADFEVGAVLALTSGEVASAGADPAAGTILGVALAAEDGAPGYNMANQPSVVTFRQKTVPVAIANGNVFRGKLTNGSSTVITPVAADIGASYGITAYSGVWYVDKAKTTTSARVVVVKSDTTTGNQLVWFRFIESFTVTI
jgi:hypothetical protein